MNYGVIGIWNKCAFHYKVLLTLLNPIMILTKFNYFWDLKSVVAQGPKRVTVNIYYFHFLPLVTKKKRKQYAALSFNIQ